MGKVVCRIACVAFLTIVCAVAQLTRGFISGTVQDAAGAVIPEVTIKITNQATGAVQETTTAGAGTYRFVAVEPGTYSIEFTKSGFELRRVEGVVVSTTQEVTVNQQLAVAGTETTIEVSAAPAGVELAKTTATIDRVLPQIVIQSLPLTGATRDVNTLSLLTPTVNRGPGSTGISASGSRARNNNFMLDGVDNNDISVTLVNAAVPPEALAEFQTQVSAYSAEFGRNTGAQINAITRSGSNSFHGEVWDYYRGNWMEPVSLLNKRAGITSTPRFVHNQYGADAGGPIIKNRTFIFGLYQGNKRREAPDARNATAFTIPTAEGYALLSTVPLRSGQSQSSRNDVLSAISFLPDVHQTIGGRYDTVRPLDINGVNIPMGTARIPLAQGNDFHNVVLRADHRLTDAHSLTYRLLLDKRTEPNLTSNLQFGTRFAADQTNYAQNHALSLTSVFGSRFVNEFRFSYVRRNLDFPEHDPLTPTTTISSAFTIGGLSNFPQGRIQNTFQWQDVATWTSGRHSVKFGADIRRVRLFNISAFNSKGTWTFNSFADYVNNSAFQLLQAVNEATFDARQTQQYYFVQDDWRVTKDLTLNIGLRYETQNIPFGFFGAATDEIAAALVPRNVQRDKNNWAPRAGFAYSPSNGGWLLGDGRTVFRGGYGMGYDVLFYNIATVTASNYPRVVTAQANNQLDLFPTLLPKIAEPGPFNPLDTFANANEDMQNPTTHFYSLSIQREIGSANILELGYSGNRQYHAIRQGRLNPGVLTEPQAALVRETRNGNIIPNLQARRLYPAYGDRVTIESTALSKYNAVFVRFDRRFTNGLVLGANYTFSNLMSDNDESLGVADITNSAPQVPQDFNNYRAEWARSVFDRPHRFVAHWVWQVPGRNSFDNRFLKELLGGWQFSGFYEVQSGQPFGMRTGVDTVGQGATNGSRPDWNPSGTFTNDPVSGDLRTFTTSLTNNPAFLTPLTSGNLPLLNSSVGGGNIGRNTFRGPYRKQWNLGFSKMFEITERWKIELRNDMINAFNQRNFGNPVSAMNAVNLGQNTTDPGTRTMLLSAKVRF